MHAENSRPAILCFAGLDPSGGAGLQADIEAIANCGGHALPIATCITVQNTCRTLSVHAINTNILTQQIDALLQDIKVSACKISVIPNTEIVNVISTTIKKFTDIPIIYDPVLEASHGSRFTNQETLTAIKSMLLPHVSIVTPNKREINALINKNIMHIPDAAEICKYGPDYVLATGADEDTKHVHNCLLSIKGIEQQYEYTRLAEQYHGSGCTLSSALACFLSQGYSVTDATLKAQDYTYQTLQHAIAIGTGQWIPSRISR